MRYNSIEHVKLLNSAIERMGNNHTKWLFALFTVIGFSITMDKFVFDLDNNIRLSMLVIVFSISIFFQILIITVSWKYLDLETKFRNKQKKVFNGKISKWDMNPTKEKGISTKDNGISKWKAFYNLSWIMKASIIITIFYAISQSFLIGLVIL